MRKTISFFIFTVMLCTMTAKAAPAVYSDTAGVECETAVSVLSALGILKGNQDGTFGPEANLTRAEMAAIISRTLGAQEAAIGENVFSDVASGHWAYKYISLAYDLGIVNGVGDGKFAPDASLTYTQAVRMIVCALGYDAQAEALGGYPSGYLAKASQLGILKNTTNAGTIISRGTTAILLYNALDVPLMKKTSYKTMTYDVTEGVNILNHYLGIEKYKGQLDANYFVTIGNPQRRLLRDEVAIGGVIFKEMDTGAANYIGRNVTAYARNPDNSSVEELIIIIPDASSIELMVSAADINCAKTTKTKLTYEKKGSNTEYSANIYDSAKALFNGAIKNTWSAGDLTLETGYVTLVLNDGLAADVVIVESFVNYVVNSVVPDDKTVTFKEAVDGISSMVLDITDSETRTQMIDTEGNPIEMSDISEWDILSVAVNDDGSYLRAVKSSQSITGKIKEISYDEVLINETAFGIAGNLKNATLLTKPELSQTAVYRLDFMGNIAAVNTDNIKTAKYGWLVGAEETKGIDKRPKFKVYTEDGEMKIYDTGDKIKFNGITIDTGALISSDKVTALSAHGAVIPQLIRFKENEEKTKLSEIETANDCTANPDDEAGSDNFNKIMELGYSAGTSWPVMINGGETSKLVTYIGGNICGFMGRLMLRSTTKVFVIPEADSKDGDYGMKLYTEFKHSTDIGGENLSYTSLFDIDDNYVVGAMVWNKGLQSSGGSGQEYPPYTAPVALVKSVSKAINEDGEMITLIKVLDATGEEISISGNEDFECLYGVANSDFENDPDWYTSIAGDGSYVRGAVIVNGFGVVKGRPNMFMKLKDLDVGDVIQYVPGSGDKANTISVFYRANTPGDVEMAALYKNISATTRDSLYQSGDLIANGTIIRASKYGILAEGNAANAAGQKIGGTYIHTYPAAGLMVTFNREKGTHKTITWNDMREGDKFLAVWHTNMQKLFIIYR